ncbi:phosphoenolpyruvate--protein phosphotransferase [Curtanaerobium respiraculi]|uniref:phosphoenolpyruvate--protein phosphotransferase n=1 Tax=Curtanaerobium respiraculi TaxID=2949669 RepID=UPI0024B3637B|nr:phosphoenolpyruvate--protein phosphotransferase [Curtanaerobium respiraculi]
MATSELKGVAASAGIGIGQVVAVAEPDLTYAPHAIEDVSAEIARFDAAIASYIEHTNAQAEAVSAQVGPKEAEILTGHVVMISDPYMQGEMKKLIEGGSCAEDALVQICDMFASMFEQSGDELTMQRATDVRDVKTGVLAELLGRRPVDIASLPMGTVIVTHDLTPSMCAEITGAIVAVIAETGGLTSHSAILARAMELPAILSAPGALDALSDGTTVVVDGSTGTVQVEPDHLELDAAMVAQKKFAEDKAALQAYEGKPTATADGVAVELVSNIGTPEDANAAMERDAEGIGLFRTEFLFMDNTSMPTEEEQFAAYKKVAIVCKGKPVIIRTLDIGGDKEIGYLGMQKEDNPFMGFRAVRFCLSREDVYIPQLRALLRASAFGDIRIMVPLVTCVDELRQVKALVARCMEELDAEGRKYNKDIPIGVMVETPAAAIMADVLAKEASFFSIGTNDLTGYTMCADRGNEGVRYLYSTWNPAVLRSIRAIISAGRAEGIPVGMCGEAAADPLLVPLWIAFGLTEYSVSSTSVLSTRREIARWTVADAQALAERVMHLATADEVRKALEAAVAVRAAAEAASEPA